MNTLLDFYHSYNILQPDRRNVRILHGGFIRNDILEKNRLQGDKRDRAFLKVGTSSTKRYPAHCVNNQAANSTEGEMTVSHLTKKFYTIYGTRWANFSDLKANEIQSIRSHYNKRPVVFFIIPSTHMYSKQSLPLSFRKKNFACVFYFTHNYMGRMYRPARVYSGNRTSYEAPYYTVKIGTACYYCMNLKVGF